MPNVIFSKFISIAQKCRSNPCQENGELFKATLADHLQSRTNSNRAADVIDECFKTAAVIAENGKFCSEALRFFDFQLRGRENVARRAPRYNCAVIDDENELGYTIVVRGVSQLDA